MRAPRYLHVVLSLTAEVFGRELLHLRTSAMECSSWLPMLAPLGPAKASCAMSLMLAVDAGTCSLTSGEG
jgi:hypothetical protein